MGENVNDNERIATFPTTARSPDPSGYAALLLIEVLIRSLISRGVITPQDAIGIVDTVEEIWADIADESGDAILHMNRSLPILGPIVARLKTHILD